MTQKLCPVYPVSNAVINIGSHFSGDQTDDSCKTPAFFIGKGRQADQIKNQTDAYYLFQKLGKSGNGG